MIMNKKGQSSTIGVTIAIVLGVALIVFLIWGFSTNWNMFSSTASAYAGQTNVDTVSQACQMQCQNNQETEFCSVEKSVIKADNTKASGNCFDLKAAGTLSFTCTSVTCACGGQPTPGKERKDAEEKVIPCSNEKNQKACVAYPGCTWS